MTRLMVVLGLLVSLFAEAEDGGPSAGNSASLGLRSNYYLSDASAPLTPQLVGDWRGESTGGFLQGTLALGGGINVGKPRAYYWYVSEAYLSKSFLSGETKLSFGRKLETWSVADRFWGAGAWQPRFRWDYLEPLETGLSGLFLTNRSDTGEVTLFGSPLYFPEQGGSLEFVDGSCANASLNAWISCPASQVPILGVDTPVDYRLQLPPLSQIVFNPSVGVTGAWGAGQGALREETGAWVRASYGYKPRSAILLSYSRPLRLDRGRADVTLYPRAAYHHLATLESGLLHAQGQLWVSLTRDQPVEENLDPELAHQRIAPATLASLGTDFKLMRVRNGHLKVALGYLHKFAEPSTDLAPANLLSSLSFSGRSLFDEAYPFTDLVSGVVETPVPWVLGDRLRFRWRGLYEPATATSQLSGSFVYETPTNWRAYLGADVLSGDGQSNYIAKYRQNDRVYWGLSYVF
ncbi:MAG: hypothetical protein AB7P04_00280 [Bacteriovoracia bacterium]